MGALSLFGGGPDARLCKMVRAATKSSPVRTILEIGIDDGSRAVAMLETLCKVEENVRYLAIDAFDIGGQSTLKQFHQLLRANRVIQDGNLRPQLLPGTISDGLLRVANTVGTVDLMVIAAPRNAWSESSVLPLISRVSHDKTTILYRQDETWSPLLSRSDVPQQRRAA